MASIAPSSRRGSGTRCFRAKQRLDLITGGLRGVAREIVVRELLCPVLPAELECVTGCITDWEGRQFTHADVVVIDPRLIAPVMVDRQQAVVPLDCCLCAVEVKSRLTAAEVRDAVGKARSVRELRFSPPTVHTILGEAGRSGQIRSCQALLPQPVLTCLFAFGSDLSAVGMSEFDRYCQIDDQAFTHPALNMICVLGRGFWRTDGYATVGSWYWAECPPSEDHDEVIDFLGVLANTAPELARQRGSAKLGQSIIKCRDYTRISSDGPRESILG